jgi:septum site-determining protein MinC
MGLREKPMSSIHAESSVAAGGPALEVKGTITPVTVLCLRSTDVAAIERELRARVAPAPQMFLHAPVVLDVAGVDAEDVPLAAVVEVARRCKLIPVGVAHLPPERIALATELGLAVVQLGFGRSRAARAASSAPSPAPAPPPVRVLEVVEAPPPEHVPTMTVRQPVRGGQVIYAPRGDLVVMGPVNPGAQVIADGHVHIYGRLRGRALAGARGLSEARVFCHGLEAELVSVAGDFLTADDIPADLRGKPAQIYMENGSLRMAPL